MSLEKYGDVSQYVHENVNHENEPRWLFFCPDGDFESIGWPSRDAAELRGTEHLKEHLDMLPMTELHEFQVNVGIK